MTLKENLEDISKLLRNYEFIKNISVFDKSGALSFEVTNYESMENLKKEIIEKIKGDYYEFGAESKIWQNLRFNIGNQKASNGEILSRTQKFTSEFRKYQFYKKLQNGKREG